MKRFQVGTLSAILLLSFGLLSCGESEKSLTHDEAVTFLDAISTKVSSADFSKPDKLVMDSFSGESDSNWNIADKTANFYYSSSQDGTTSVFLWSYLKDGVFYEASDATTGGVRLKAYASYSDSDDVTKMTTAVQKKIDALIDNYLLMPSYFAASLKSFESSDMTYDESYVSKGDGNFKGTITVTDPGSQTAYIAGDSFGVAIDGYMVTNSSQVSSGTTTNGTFSTSVGVDSSDYPEIDDTWTKVN